MIKSLDVIIWGKKAGTLISPKTGYGEKILFYFDPDFTKNGWDIAPLRASIKNMTVINGLPIYPESDRLFSGLPSFIADSLPDHWGNTVFNEWAKANHIRTRDLSPLDRLAYIGKRGMGALEFKPSIAENFEEAFKVEISGLSALAQKSIEEARDFHSAINPDLLLESLFKVGTSAGGRRPKAVINVNMTTGECYSGQVPAPVPGFIPSIIKFDEHNSIPTTRIEYSYYEMAISNGINMMPSHLIECHNETHFLTERFDRHEDHKIHIQTLAAMNPLSSSYEDLFDTALRIDLTPAEISQLFHRMVMNVLCGNVDDHNKNFSFLMDIDGIWRITPAYDFTFTIDPSAPGYVNRHSLSVNGKIQNISNADLLTVADRFNIKSASSIIEKSVTAAKQFHKYAEQNKVPERWIDIITSEISERIRSLSKL